MSSDSADSGSRRSIRIGKYEVLAHVASGGMGAVYKARDTDSGCDIALKVLSPEMASKPAMLERFRREAKHAAKLRHENIVALYDFGEASQTYFLVMEYVEGIDLHDYCNKNGPLDPHETLDIVTQACRALDHAFQQGVVHRDIKPSNFLLAQRGERRLVKLTDLGLARETDSEDYRVTRAGTTVGTLDYMAPEQACDSGSADVRSDLYSLGGTWYHLLVGHAPFPKGGLAERLHRLLHEKPPDVREGNPAVSREMAAVVHRLLAKHPSRRYQTPAELLRDLNRLARGKLPIFVKQARQKRAAKHRESRPQTPKEPRRPAEGRRTPRHIPTPTIPELQARKSTAEVPAVKRIAASPRSYRWYALGGVAAAFLACACLVAVLFARHRQPGDAPTESMTESPPPKETPPAAPPIRDDLPKNREPKWPADERTTNVPLPKKTAFPPLYSPSNPIDADALRKEVESPWSAKEAHGPTVELFVGRFPTDPAGKRFSTLSAACKAIPAGATGIIELRDNGPFFDLPAELADRGLILRAGAGYRPLLVWDVQRMLDERRRAGNRRDAKAESDAQVFLALKRGDLTLEGIHFALKWPNAPSVGAALFALDDGDFRATDCTFSLVGKPRDGMTLARFGATATASERSAPDKGNRCRFSRCYVRGPDLTVLDLDALGAQVLIEDCLLVGGDAPLIRVRADAARPTHLSVVRSTLSCGKTLLTLRRVLNSDSDPALHWFGWDSLLSRHSQEVGGELLRLSDDTGSGRVSWRAVNCLYAGWENLLAGKQTIPASDISGWRRQWGRMEGDEVRAESWPAVALTDDADVPPCTFRTTDGPVAFSSSTDGDRALGCDLKRLPATRDNWLSLTFERFPILTPPLPEDAGAPRIPSMSDRLYHGEKLDLERIDLGAHLRNVQKTYRLAPRVVLHLTGKGAHRTTPLHVQGSSLVLYFEPTSEDDEPLTLVPSGDDSAEALVTVEKGDLSIYNGHLRFSSEAGARALPWLIHMSGGDVRLFHSHLQVPPKESGSAFRGLIALDGSGDASSERVHSCTVNECVLLSERDALAVRGIGVRVLLAQSLVIAGGSALRLTLDADESANKKGVNGNEKDSFRANVQCLLDRVTVSARGAVIRLPDVKRRGALAEPVIVQTRDCGFVNLFAGRTNRPGLLLYEGEALARGLLVWQSDNDSFDKRLWFAAATSPPEKQEDHASWSALWGAPNWRPAQLELSVYRTLDAERWLLERLAGWKAPGANLDALDLARKSKSKMPR